MMRLKFFYSEIDDKEIQLTQRALSATYEDVLDVIIGGRLELIKKAYNPERDQYDADIFLRHLINRQEKDVALWMIKKDLYCMGTNFVFGYANYSKGAVLSIYRLSSQELIEKEAIHEVGHVLGLRHCRNRCVMQFSNSLWEAKTKPLHLCETCQRKLVSL